MLTKQWIKALRLPSGMGTALAVIAGFRHSHQPIDWSVVITVFFTTCLAMLWNDYHDREIDVAKGRFLASLHPVWFLRYTLTFAVISLGLTVLVGLHNPSFGMLCAGMWITCMVYHKAQKNPVAKNAIVGLNVGATVVFPLLVDSKILTLWVMAGTLVVITSVREFLKDVEDMEVDRGKKRTLALVINSSIKKKSASCWRSRLFLSLLGVVLVFLLWQ
jgi:4-hydroxybenzoate polyprenyltransferase